MNETFIDQALGSGIPYVTLAVPIFFILIGLELWVAKSQGKKLYRLNDSISDLSCGIVQQMFGVFTAALTIFAYAYLFDNYALFDVRTLSPLGKWVAAGVLFFGIDLAYYWFHRMSHQVNFLWAAHMVHHQSEEYNLSVALRQSVVQGWFSWAWYLPLAVLGFPTGWMISMLSLNILYQFWVHTCTVDKLGPLESFLNTPSHHRVHHGKNPQYIDRNHAGTLIIWDKIFGTFEPEGEPVVYGTTRELKSWNPLWANVFEWKALYDEAKTYPKWADRVRLFVKPPGWRPEYLPEEPPHTPMTVETQIRYDSKPSAFVSAYALFQFVVMLVAGVGVLVSFEALGLAMVFPGALWVVLTSMFIGGMFEERTFVWTWEPLRLLGGLAMAGYYLKDVAPVWAVPLGGVILFAYPLYRFLKERPTASPAPAPSMMPT